MNPVSKEPSWWCLAGLCGGALLVSACAQQTRSSTSAERPAVRAPAELPRPVAESSPAPVSAVTPAGRAKMGPHPSTKAFDRAVDPTLVSTPPPAAPREESMPPRPGEDYVWVPGSYVPVERQWTWTPGKWSMPPDRGDVWIPSRYDPIAQRWTSGYWQPGDTSGSATAPKNPSAK